MLASLFDGAQGLFIWTFDWLNFRAWGQGDFASTNAAQSTSQTVLNSPAIQSTPKGSFEQIDRGSVLDDIALWSDAAPALASTSEPAELIGKVAWIEEQENSDSDLLIQLALADPNGLETESLEALSALIQSTPAFSPVVQPVVHILTSDEATSALVTVQGTANAGFDGVYLPLQFSLEDSLGDQTDFDLRLPIWNTDLI